MIEILNSKQIPLSKLTANNGQIEGIPKNPRFIKNERYQKLVKSIQDNPEFLGARELIVHEHNGKFVVLCGNMRYRASKELGFDSIPCKVIPEYFSIEQIKAIIIKDNISFGDDDFDALANEWDATELEEWGFEFPDLGEDFEPEILEAQEDDYEMPEQMKVDVVLGDLIEIGEHRLLCGDSTDSDAVARLMNGEKADMVFTDPPYGISHSGKGIKGATKENDFGEILGDNDVSVAIGSFNLCQSEFPDATLIFWGANYYCSTLPDGFGWLVWDKEKEGDTFSGAELAFVNKGIRLDVFRHRWHGMIKASEMGEKRLHPTQKPVALVEFCFTNYQAGKSILDLFLGSGSTMVAAHQLKRKCYGMELDPKYCQVIIDRMRKLDPILTIKINGQIYNK
jgi:16S rRNA G966 N2-methylase RsmD